MVKFLNEEQAADLIPIKKGKYTWLYKELAKLKVGQAIVIETGDWKTKSLPYKTVRVAGRALNMTFDYGRMPDGNGWLVKRIK